MRASLTSMLAILFAAGTALPQPGIAQGPGTMPTWDALNQQQRDSLVAPLRDRWDANPEQRPEMLQRAERWQQMTPEQRRQGRKGMQRWKDMSPEARDQMRALHGTLRALPDAERAALRERWKAMTPEQRRAWVAAHPAQHDTGAPPRSERRDR